MTCYRCGQERPPEAFITRIDDRHYRMCRVCLSEILTKRGTSKVRLAHTATHRTRYLCRRVLPIEQFTRRRTGTYFSGCKDCNRHVFAQRRRARLRAAEGQYSTAEWDALVRLYDACPRCRRPWASIPRPAGWPSVITADHIVPLAKGGSNRIENIQPLCYSCNSAKGHR